MFGKLFASLYQGTLRGRAHALLVFTNMIACCDRRGEVDKTARAIADEVGLTLAEVLAAISELEAPDPESRSPTEEGRRIIRLEATRTWGWRIVNYGKYRAIRDDESRQEQNRLAQAGHRKRLADSKQDKPASASVSPKKPRQRQRQRQKQMDSTPSPSLNQGSTTSTSTLPGRDRIKGVDKQAAKAALIGEDPCPMARAFGCSVSPNNAQEWRREASRLNLRMVDLLLVLDYAAHGLKDPVRLPSGVAKAWLTFCDLGKENMRGWAIACQEAYGFK